MKTTSNNNSENNVKVMKLQMLNGWPCKGTWTLDITEDEWNDHGIKEAGYYKVGKRCEGKAGIVVSAWLAQKTIARINEYFAK